MSPGPSERDFDPLVAYLRRVPAIRKEIHPGSNARGEWWVQFDIDIRHRLAWNVVQEFAYVLNNLSLTSVLPTVFKPMSPPPYLNGGPDEYLSWVIECSDRKFRPKRVREWLEGRLPRPVDDLSKWDAD
jgi:hypothetical protein